MRLKDTVIIVICETSGNLLGETIRSAGDREGSGEIALAEEGGSGISGVVQWDGNPICGVSGGLDAKLECPA